jgi:hypothetical protein
MSAMQAIQRFDRRFLAMSGAARKFASLLPKPGPRAWLQGAVNFFCYTIR